jgi:hypothetical protein
VEAVAQLGWSFTGRSNEGLTVEARRGRRKPWKFSGGIDVEN